MIDKRLPRKLNKSADSRVRSKTDMFDAVNVSISEDNRSGDGNAGVIKPLKSNISLNVLDNDSNTKYVIGKCIDSKYDVIYFFVHNPSDTSLDGVYAYDPDGYLPIDHDVNDIVTIYTSENFGFEPDMFVKADITYTQQRFIFTDGEGDEAVEYDYEDTPMLFFTNNKNEPKKLNILRAITGDGPNVDTAGGSEAAEKDFIIACPKTPVQPPLGEWGNDTSVPGNEFLNIEGFQFAYQCVYIDQNETAISTYSDVYVPPGYLSYNGQGDTIAMDANNMVKITIPTDDISDEVKSIKVLGRRGESGSWFLLGSVTKSNPVFNFNNTEVNSAIPRDIQTKDFDSLPYRAQAQTIIDNRLMYGNYVEGRDQSNVSATITPQPEERPIDFAIYDVTAIPSVVPSPTVNGSGAQNKNMGFVIDTSGITQETNIAAGSTINFSFTVSPKQNFHVYNATNSYHQSPQMGEDFDNEGWGQSRRASDSTGNLSVQADISEETERPRGFYWQNSTDSGAQFIKDQRETFRRIPAICSDGVNKVWRNDGSEFMNTKWRWRSTDPTTFASPFSGGLPVDFGTSAGNPLIVQGKDFTITCSFVAKFDLSKQQISRAIALILDGQTLSRDPASPNELDSFASDFTPPSAQSLTYSFDAGLRDNSFIPEQSANAKLITMLGAEFTAAEVANDFKPLQGSGGEGDPTTTDTDGDGSETGLGRVVGDDSQDLIRGFIILNKADVEFGLFLDETYLEERDYSNIGNLDQFPGLPQDGKWTERKDPTKQRVGLYIKGIDIPPDEDAVLSCMRRPWPGSRWYCFKPWSSPDSLVNPDGFINRSLFSNSGAGYAGLQNLNEFAPAMSNSIDVFTEQIHGEGENDDVRRFSVPINYATNNFTTGSAIRLMTEKDLFRDNPAEVSENISLTKAPWSNVFGGLSTRGMVPNFLASQQQPLRFFTGEKPGGQSCYSLMDGASGPGGREVHPKAHYNNYVLYLQNGYGEGGRVFGINNIGSAPLFSMRDTLVGTVSTNDGAGALLQEGDFSFGVYGPALSNNILVAIQEDGFGSSDFDAANDTKFPKFLDPDSGDILPTSIADDNDPIRYVTSLPLVHSHKFVVQGTTSSSYLGAYLPTIPIDTSSADHGGEHHIGENDDQVYELKNTNAEARNVQIYILPPGGEGSRTFKAGANHSFGVVFYDSRGRASNVHPIGSVNAPWYSERDRKGAISMDITLSGDVPSYATHFQIVYSGNTSFSRYIQYSSAGAFVAKGGEANGNIYVSLNYLQDHPASLAKSFGARSVDGSQDVYTFRQGDRLRIVSFYQTLTSRIFPNVDFQFNIIDQVNLSEGTDNPLYDVEQDGETPHPAKTGAFLVLENNPNANGFTFEDVKFGENDINAQTHNWNKRCVVEINSPKKGADEDSLVYYETSNVFPIGEFSTAHNITNGDSWWRSVPMNFSKISGNDVFETLITEDNTNPNFFPYYTESDRFSYKVLNSDVNGKGKFKLFNPNEQKAYRSSSITFSDKNNPASSLFTLTSFNPTKGQFKDLPIEYGDINYIAQTDDSIFVIQSSRCSSIPVNRNIITDLGDNQSLVAAKAVLGTAGFYAGDYGCDDNPESVCEVDTNIYFASKSNREVYRFNRSNGIQVISDAGMKSYFRKLFRLAERDAIDGLGPVKVVGGYDPEKDSFILSVFNLDDISSNPIQDVGSIDESEGVQIVSLEPTSVTIDAETIRASLPDDIALDADGSGRIGAGDLLALLAVFGTDVNTSGSITFDAEDVTFNEE